MTKRSRRTSSVPEIASGPTPTGLLFADGVLSGQFTPQSDVRHVAVFADQRFIDTAPAIDVPGTNDRTFHAAVPAVLFARNLSVRDAATGQSVGLPTLDFTAFRAVRWDGWSVQDKRIDGRFTIIGTAPPPRDVLVPVTIARDGQHSGIAFAECDDEDDAAPGRSYRFSLPVPTLPSLTEPYSLVASVGGLAVPGQSLRITAKVCGVAGYLDAVTGTQVIGWAIDLAKPGGRQQVEVRIGDRTIATGTANQPRTDLDTLGVGNGRSAFVIPLPHSIPMNQEVEFGVVLAGTDTHLANSPFLRPAVPRSLGFFDAVDGLFAGGWVVNMHAPEKPFGVEAVCGGQVIGTGLANLYRGDVETAGLPTARCGFRFMLDRPVATLLHRDIVIRIVETGEVVAGSPRQVTQNKNITRFLGRNALSAPLLARLGRQFSRRTQDVMISLVMPVYNTRREWLVEALNSVLGQWSANWELICVDDASTEPHVPEILAAAQQMDPRIRILRAPFNAGIAVSINFGLRAARGDYVAFLDHDDVIEPDAVYHLARAAQDTGAELIYSDEAITTDDINSVIDVRARPAFSYDYYLSHPYFVHLIAVRTDVARRVTGWDESLAISADVDFVLRVLETATVVAHVPRVLYRWRTHATSTGHTRQGQVTTATRDAIARHLDRRHLPATVHDGLRYNEYRLDWPDDGGEVLIVIPTKNRVDLLRPCIESIEKTSHGANYRIVVIDHQSTDPKTVRYLAKIAEPDRDGPSVTVMPYTGVFNYPAMNNSAVKAHGEGARYVLFLNNDVEAIAPGWIQRLRSLAGRPEVGAVGPLLLYGDDRVQHAGVLVGFSDAADHAMKFVNAYLSKGNRSPGYNCNLTTVRDYSAVTAACMMMRMDVFRAVDGFDERFVVGFNDTDLCLRIGEAGWKILYDGFTVLYHHESATRTVTKEVAHPDDDRRLRTRWARFFTDGDPFYSPLLAAKGSDHTLRADPGCKGLMAVRAVRLDGAPKRTRRRKSKVA